TTNEGLPLAIANNSIEFIEIELPNEQRVRGDVLASSLSFAEGVSCEAISGSLGFDTIESNVHITQLYLGNSNAFQVDANISLGARMLGDVQWDEKGLDCKVRVNTTQDFILSQIPEEWSVFTRGVDLDLAVSGPSFDSLTTKAQFHHPFFTGTAMAKLYNPRYDLKGNIHLHQHAYDSTVLAEWLPEPEMQAADLQYSIQGSFESGALAYDLGASKGMNTARIWSKEWKDVARLELNLPHFQQGPLSGGSVKAAIKPNLEALFTQQGTQVVGLAPTLLFDDYAVRGLSFNWQHLSTKDSIWWSCLDSLMDIDGSLVAEKGTYKVQSNINALGLELLDPLDTGQILSARLSAEVKEDLTGFINAQHLLLQRPTDVVFISAFDVVHEMLPMGRRIGVSSDVMQGYIEGSFDWQGLSAIPGVLFSDLAGGPKVITNVNAKLAFEASTIDWLSQLLHLGVVLPEGGYMVANFNGSSSSWNYSLNVPHLSYNGIEAFAIEGEGSKERRGIQAFLKAGAVDGISTPLDSIALRWDSPTDFQQFTALAHVRDSVPTSLLAGAEYKAGTFTPNLIELQMGAHQASLVGASPVFWNSTSFDSDSLMLQGSLGTIRMSGGLGALATNPLRISLSNINAHWLNYWYREPRMQFDGRLDAILRVEESFPNLEGSGSLQWSNVQLNRELLGNFNSTLQWSTAANDIFLNG
ncbi:MAG: hypothetical protein VW775_05960, partial [Schleiferiaceae bacterium]